jgi:phage gp36-like protein
MAVYHAITDLYPSPIPEAQMVQLTNDVGGDTIDVSVWEEIAEDVEARIDAAVGVRYALPLATVPRIVRRIAVRLVAWEIWARRFPEGVPEGIRSRGQRAEKELDDIARGRLTLGEQPTPEENPEMSAQLVSHTRVFSRDSLRGF